MANLSVLRPGKWILDISGKICFDRFSTFFGHLTFFQKIRSGPLTLAGQGSILAGAPTVIKTFRPVLGQQYQTQFQTLQHKHP